MNESIFFANELRMDEHTTLMEYDDWDDEEEYECFSHTCDNCGHKTNDPKETKTWEGTDADGNRGWEIFSLACPECGFDY